MTDYTFEGIPTFSGNFWGQGYTIKGIELVQDGSVVGFEVGPQAVKPKTVVNANKLNNFFIVFPPILSLDQSIHSRNKVSSMNL